MKLENETIKTTSIVDKIWIKKELKIWNGLHLKLKISNYRETVLIFIKVFWMKSVLSKIKRMSTFSYLIIPVHYKYMNYIKKNCIKTFFYF